MPHWWLDITGTTLHIDGGFLQSPFYYCSARASRSHKALCYLVQMQLCCQYRSMTYQGAYFFNIALVNAYNSEGCKAVDVPSL